MFHHRTDRADDHEFVAEGGFNSFMNTISDSYLAPFAIFLRATPFQSGLLATLPACLGSAAQLASLMAISKSANRRGLILFGALVQLLAWIPLLVLALFPECPFGLHLLLGICVLLSLASNFTSPVWYSLVGDVVSADRRGDFFARKSRRGTIGNLLALGLAAGTLELCTSTQIRGVGFLLLFILAFSGKIFSIRGITRFANPSPVSELDTVGNFQGSSRRRLLLFNALFQGSMAFGGTYLTVFLLTVHAYSYGEFSLVLLASLAGQYAFSGTVGRAIDTYGPQPVMVIRAIVVSAVPFFWLGGNLPLVCTGQFIAGAAWVGYSSATQAVFLGEGSAHARAKLSALFGVSSAWALLIGALLGGYLLRSFDDTSATGYETIFLVSALARGACLLLVTPCLLNLRFELFPVSRGWFPARLIPPFQEAET